MTRKHGYKEVYNMGLLTSEEFNYRMVLICVYEKKEKQYARTCMYLVCINHRVSLLTIEEKLSGKSGNCKGAAMSL